MMKAAETSHPKSRDAKSVAVVDSLAGAEGRAATRAALAEWNDTRADYPRLLCVHQLFEAQAKRCPNNVAAIFGRERLTYAKLNERANKLAHYLRRLGVGPEARVGLFVERSLDLIVGLLGILKAGGAYVPLDPMFPAERLRIMLEDAGIAALVTRSSLPPAPAGPEVPGVRLDEDWQALSQESDADPENRTGPENLAYVIYTSGSTGRPKGVQVTHRSVVNFLSSMRERPGLSASDVVLSVTTISFDIAALEIFLPLTTGATVAMAGREVASDGARLMAELARTRTTVLQATPATWRLLLAAGWPGDPKLKIFCGGEALPFTLAERLLERGAELWNLYGPTETTIWSTAHRITAEDERVYVGRPIANTQAYILDESLDPTPVGEAGELHIGGDGLARGYLNRPDLTAEKFIPDPFGGEPGARLYKTGDLARYMPDGKIECLGRIDHQVKIRGFRIETGEVEAALTRHPSVREAVVAANEDAQGDGRLVAYVVTIDGDGAFASPQEMSRQLRAFVRERLPEYMVPSLFVRLDALPLTANGKIDRNSLPAPAEPAFARREFIAPRDPLEHQLAEIWEELFDTRPIGVRDDFFDLGGHSLLAARMMDEVARACGKRLPLDVLHKGATVEYLAAMLLQQEAAALQAPAVAIQPGGSLRPFFYLHGDFSGGGFYCMTVARRLGGERPFYALPPHGADGGLIPRTIEEMAALHIRTLRSLQPKGPYLLGGFCNGALVAFEMARQLEEQGEAVDLLVLIYASAINARYRKLNALARAACRALRLGAEREAELFLKLRRRAINLERRARHYSSRLREVSRDGLRQQLMFVGRHARWAASRAAGALGRIGRGAAGAPPQAMPRPGEENFDPNEGYRRVIRWDITDAYHKVMDSYVPREYRGTITLFWPDEAEPELPGDPTMGWDRIAPRVETHSIAGKHLTCITRHADVLADRLKACLEKIQD